MEYIKFYFIYKFNNLFKFFFFITILFFLLACSTTNSNTNSPINIKNINISTASNRAPKESNFQIDIELSGMVSDENLKQDLQYKWFVEYMKLDISTNKDLSIDINTVSNSVKNYYFLDISKNPLNAILSVYQQGYYKITLQASNINEVKEYSIIIKAGKPALPTLFVKFNIPKQNKVDKNDFKGQFYLGYNDNLKTDKKNISEIKANEILDNWYNTKIEVNPFNSFIFESGTHIANGTLKYINSPENYTVSKENDNLKYDYQNDKHKIITTSPIILKDIKQGSIFSIYKDGIDKWEQGEIYISYLSWENENGLDKFNYFENKINAENKSAIFNLNNKYLVKVFIGSYGQKFYSNNCFVYFTTKGTYSDEFDPEKKRDFPGLPYGYLIGKLGIDGTAFPIGNKYNYDYLSTTPVYFQDENNKFILSSTSN